MISSVVIHCVFYVVSVQLSRSNQGIVRREVVPGEL